MVREGFEVDFEDTAYGFLKRLEFIVESIERNLGHPFHQVRVLEVGCGTGNFISVPLAKLGLRVTGIDVHAPSIEYAQKAASEHPNLDFKLMGVADCQEHAYDVVVCSEVLEHIDQYDGFLAETVKRMRSSRSILIVTVPNGRGPSEAQRWVWRNLFEGTRLYCLLRNAYHRRRGNDNSSKAFLNSDSRHVNFFTMSRLNTLFEKQSLEILEYRGRTFLCGVLVNLPLRLPGLQRVNNWLGTVLPHWLVSGWMFTLLQKKENSRADAVFELEEPFKAVSPRERSMQRGAKS